MLRLVHRYAAQEAGASAIEYAIVASLIAVAIIGVIGTIGLNLVGKMNEVIDAIGEAGT